MIPRSSFPRTTAAILLLVVLPFAWPCGPYFNDAHHGLDRDPLQGSLETFYARLTHPGSDLEVLGETSRTAVKRAVDAEHQGLWTEALSAWRESILTMGFDAVAVHSWQIRDVRDRIDLLPTVGKDLSREEWQAYLATMDMQLGLWSTRPTEIHRESLLAMASSANVHIASAALTTLGWQELLSGHVSEARTDFSTALSRDPAGVKSDECSYLMAVAPVFAHLGRDLRIEDPGTAIANIEEWLVAHPASPWRAHARGWQAALLYHNRNLAWKGDADGLLAATRIWQGLLTDSAAVELFTSAAESLRLAYRKLRPSPPGWVVSDPRHAAAFAWHAVTDRVSIKDRADILAKAEPALSRITEENVGADVLYALADTWFQAGRSMAALPLARRALALRDTPEARYLVARLCVETGDVVEAEHVSAALPATANTYDLLVRIGSAWEEQQAWGKALSAYAHANSWMDVALLSEGPMPLATLAESVRSGGPFTAVIEDAWAVSDPKRKAGYDYLPDLRRRLAVRLVRADRPREALPFFDGELQGLCAELIKLQDDLKNASDGQRPECLYALATFWYERGKKLVFIDRYWHQWAVDSYSWDGLTRTPKEEAARTHYAAEMEAMTVYHRAYPMFLELADRFPAHAHAADALYKAALCRYWLTGQTYLKSSPWWERRARDEHYWDQGDALLRRLAKTYPNSALAQDAKVVRALGKLPSEEPVGNF